jgi:aspartate aminotransferase
MKFAQRINRIKPSATLAMTAKAAELRSQGKDVLNMSVGEPDFNTPNNIINAAIQAMQSGHTRYTPGGGTRELKEAIKKKLSRDNNLNYNLNEIIVSSGGKHSLYNACQVLFEANDEVIIFTPYWVSFPDFVSVTGATPIFVNTDPLNQYQPVFDDLESKITRNTKGVIINSPSNPTGGVWSDEAIKRTIDIAKSKSLWVFSDECYEQLTYDQPFRSTFNICSDYDKILTFQSCSKTYAMTGWRIGYTCGHADVIKAMSKLQGQSTSCPNSIAQFAACEALLGDQSSVTTMKEAFKKRRDIIVSRLNAMDGVTCDTPGGAFYVFPNFKEIINRNLNGNNIKSALDLCMLLLENKSVVSVSGESFGAQENIRFSYATSEATIHEAMDRLEALISKI